MTIEKPGEGILRPESTSECGHFRTMNSDPSTPEGYLTGYSSQTTFGTPASCTLPLCRRWWRRLPLQVATLNPNPKPKALIAFRILSLNPKSLKPKPKKQPKT